MRKFKFLFLAFILMITANVVKAQDEEISDENLRRYALMMEVIDVMKKEISDITNQMIKDQDGIDGKRYVELSKAKGDEAKLAELGANDLEKKFMVLVYEMQEERKEAIGDVVQILATKMLPDGGKAYKAIKAALGSDDAVKERYAVILEKVKSEEGEA